MLPAELIPEPDEPCFELTAAEVTCPGACPVEDVPPFVDLLDPFVDLLEEVLDSPPEAGACGGGIDDWAGSGDWVCGAGDDEGCAIATDEKVFCPDLGVEAFAPPPPPQAMVNSGATNVIARVVFLNRF